MGILVVGEVIDVMTLVMAFPLVFGAVVILIERSSNMQGPAMTQMLFDKLTADKYWIIMGRLERRRIVFVSNPLYCLGPWCHEKLPCPSLGRASKTDVSEKPLLVSIELVGLDAYKEHIVLLMIVQMLVRFFQVLERSTHSFLRISRNWAPYIVQKVDCKILFLGAGMPNILS